MKLSPLAVRAVVGLLVAGLASVGVSPSTAIPSTATETVREPRIVGGKNTDIRSVPWQVFVLRAAPGGNYYICGGSFISTRWIITAAHCVSEGTVDLAQTGAVIATSELTVYSGMSNLQKTNATHESLVTQIVRHPAYSAATVINDIALIELASPVTFGSKRAAITLPFDVDATTWPAHKTAVRISGWGRVSTNGSSPSALQSATINVKGGPLDASSCGEWSLAAQYDPVQNLCAGWKRNGKDICQGDSGGPYAIKVNGLWTLAGVTSFNAGQCGKSALPGIAVRVTTFRDWLIPTPPGNLTWSYSDPLDTTATLTWDAPPDTAVLGNNGYYIEKSLDNGTTWTATSEGIVSIGVTTSDRLCDVPAGCIYRVAAVTDVNQDVGPYRFSTIPSQPRSVKVVRKSSQSVTLSWQPPSRSFESTVQDYQVYWSTTANGVFSAIPGTITPALKLKFSRPASGKLYYVVRARSTVDIPGDDYGASSTAIAVR
jgi:secreted trypsin-like serine protease